MTLRLASFIALLLSAACAGGPGLGSRAVFPVRAGQVSFTQRPTPDSLVQREMICLASAHCPREYWSATYTTGLADGIDALGVDYFDDAPPHMIWIEFGETVSLATATARLTALLQHRPAHVGANAVVWRDGRFSLVLTPSIDGGAFAILREARGDRGHKGPILTPGERWRLCTEVDVSLCPTTGHPGDPSPPR